MSDNSTKIRFVKILGKAISSPSTPRKTGKNALRNDKKTRSYKTASSWKK
jgi:hypothetical protein